MIRDRSQWPELAVLATVLAIAATASYIHLREVWLHAGAPVAAIGPLTVDGLFAAAWLRMRRRRRQGDPVGFLAWLALGLALVATVAGNLSAAWIAGHRDPLSLVVAAWPAVAFAVVWELVTGHGRPVSPPLATGAESVARVAEHGRVGVSAPANPQQQSAPASAVGVSPMPPTEEDAGPPVDTSGESPAVGLHLAPSPTPPGDRVAELVAAGAGRRRLSRELGVTEHEARELLAKRRNGAGP